MRVFLLLLTLPSLALADDKLAPVSDKAKKVHEAGFVFDGHNDLPWRLRQDGDVTFATLDIGKRLAPASNRTPRGPSPTRSTSSTGWSSAIPTTSKSP
jgi:membrane dipeptidase